MACYSFNALSPAKNPMRETVHLGSASATTVVGATAVLLASAQVAAARYEVGHPSRSLGP